jgi:hypothetical protein
MRSYLHPDQKPAPGGLRFVPIAISVILLFTLPSCSHEHDQKALSDLFHRTAFDKGVIRALPLYDSLKNILVGHLDTLFAFRDSRTPVYHGSGPDSGRTTYERRDFYIFFQRWDSADESSEDEIGPNTVPDFIYPAVRQVFDALGRSRIKGFMIWTDSTVEIPLPVGLVDDYTKASVRHLLRWKRRVDISDDPLTRDSIVAPGWTYEISVFEHEDR